MEEEEEYNSEVLDNVRLLLKARLCESYSAMCNMSRILS